MHREDFKVPDTGQIGDYTCFQRPRRLQKQEKAYRDGKICVGFSMMHESDDSNAPNIPTPVTSASYSPVPLVPTIVNGELHDVCTEFMSNK